MTGHAFELDGFQRQAIEAVESGQSVLVAAPTGAGKTVVAEHAITAALARGGKAFYTTPIKALSNQKFHDLVRVHGGENVGLLTGDNSINGDAPVVVMTTEVLRNMIYSQAGALDGLHFVVLDEVHYLQDHYRGPVWEEIIVHLPAAVRLVCLSATVSNAGELAEWITLVRGPTATVVEHHRPVELENLYCVDDRLSGEVAVLPVLVDGKPNRDGRRYDVDPRQGFRGRTRRRFATPRRADVVDLLADERLLPSIYFIFSRAACDDAVRTCVDAGLRLTEREERQRIRAIAERHVTGLSDDDLDLLAYDRWISALEHGVAAHHAGMVPPFKEAVEACFVQGLVKVVFATETLALGINMPARAVVIEKLTKFTGERHEFLTPGQYTQLTGRAGRRGIDDHGSAVVLWSPFVSFDEVAGLAGSRSFRLTSAFRPTYNMATNLVRRYSAGEAHHLLNLSFAQFQSDRAVVRLESRLAERTSELAQLERAATCDRGDVRDYQRNLDLARRSGEQRASDVDDALHDLKPGDVLWLHGGKSAGPAAVLSVAHRRGGTVRIRVVTPGRRVLNLGSADFDDPPRTLAQVKLPSPFEPQSHAFQREVARTLHRLDVQRPARQATTPSATAHPVASCPDASTHLRALRDLDRTRDEVDRLKRRVRGHAESLARQFDRVLQLLEAWGHLEGWALTRRGEKLVRIYHECDLLIAEAVEAGLLDDLDAPSLAALASCFTFEHRSSTPPSEPWFPPGVLRHRFAQLEQLAEELTADETDLRLPITRRPDPGFVAMAHAWTSGDELDEVLADEEMSGGDFVRNMKQLLDLLRQVADAAGSPTTARTAREAADLVFRGIVAASSTVSIDGNEGEGVDDDLVETAP